jgi:hypothetical protein
LDLREGGEIVRKKSAVAGLLISSFVLLAACSDEPPTTPVEPGDQAAEPDLTFEFADCDQLFDAARPEGKARALFRVFDGQVVAVSLVRQVRRNAYYGRYDVALEKAWHLADLVNEKLPGRLVDPCGSGPPTVEQGAAQLINEVFALAGDPDATEPPLEIPEDALLPTGGFGRVVPGVPDTIRTNNAEAAFIADAGSFDGDAPVTVVLTRLADPVPGAPDFPIPGYQAYPEAYDVSADRDLVGTAEFWMCVVEPLPEVVDFFDLVIGHDLGDGEAELLTPPLYQDFNGQVIDCANAAFQPVVVGSAGAPGWLQLAGTILEPVVNRILDVEPLNAMYFAGTGLGGRGGSLSSFAPVDSGYDSFFLDFDVTGLGQLEIDGSAVCGNEPDAGFCSRVPYPPDTNVLITAVSYPGYVFDSWVGCDNPDGLQCEMTMDADKLVEATFVVASGPVLTVTIPGRTEVTASNGEALFFTCDGGLEGNTCQAVFGAEDIVTLTTTVWPELQARLWSGVICSEGSDNQSTCTFSMVGDQNVVLQFDTPV